MNIVKNRKVKVNVMQNPPTLPETWKRQGGSQIRQPIRQELITCRNLTGIRGDSLNSIVLSGRVNQFSHTKMHEHFTPILQ